jgi:hypothetical protein
LLKRQLESSLIVWISDRLFQASSGGSPRQRAAGPLQLFVFAYRQLTNH